MNIRDLQYLVAVYELNSFSKAAERCFVSQPTLSGQLKKMETGLGAKLIERSTRKVLFTRLGEKIVAQARDVLSSVDKIQDLARQSEDPMSGDIHLGLIPTIGPFLLPKIMPEISKTFPKMKLYLYELQTDVLIDKLLHGSLDAIVLAKMDWDHPIEEIPLYSENLRFAINSADPLASEKEPISLSVLDGRSVLMLEDGHCLRDQAMGVCFSAGADEDQRFKATSLDTLLHMVATGAGTTLVPELAGEKGSDGVAFLDFESPAPSRDIIMATRLDTARAPSLKGLAALISDLV